MIQAELVRACKAKFDEQLSRVYTRAVYQEYKKQYNNSTTFVIEPNPDPRVKNGWLVKHENGEGSFCWAQHEFKVVADKEAGEYSCECKQWEHIGMMLLMLCPHTLVNCKLGVCEVANFIEHKRKCTFLTAHTFFCKKKCRAVLHAHH